MKQAPRFIAHAMRTLAAALCLCLLPACVTLDYDLAAVSVPISAKPAPEGVQTRPFKIERKNVLWVHGLVGQQQPDVAALIQAEAKGATAVHGLRITQAGSFHDWLLTHLSATLLRMKTVVIEGQLEGGN